MFYIFYIFIMIYKIVVTSVLCIWLTMTQVFSQFTTGTTNSWTTSVNPSITVYSSKCDSFLNMIKSIPIYNMSGQKINFFEDIYKNLVTQKKLGFLTFGAWTCPKRTPFLPRINPLLSEFSSKIQIYGFYGMERHPLPWWSPRPVTEYNTGGNQIASYGFLQQTFNVINRIAAANYTISTQPYNFINTGLQMMIIEPWESWNNFEYDETIRPSRNIIIDPRNCKVIWNWNPQDVFGAMPIISGWTRQ